MKLLARQRLYVRGKGTVIVCSLSENGMVKEEEKEKFMQSLIGKIIADDTPKTSTDAFSNNLECTSVEASRELMWIKKTSDVIGVVFGKSTMEKDNLELSF